MPLKGRLESVRERRFYQAFVPAGHGVVPFGTWGLRRRCTFYQAFAPFGAKERENDTDANGPDRGQSSVERQPMRFPKCPSRGQSSVERVPLPIPSVPQGRKIGRTRNITIP